MIAAAVLFDAYVTLGTVFCVGANVVGRFAVVGALGQPLFDDFAAGGRMVLHAAHETEHRFARITCHLFRAQLLAADDHLAVGARTKAQLRMRLDVVLEGKVLVSRAQLRFAEQRQHQVLRHQHVAQRGHAADARRNALIDLRLEMHGPAIAAIRMAARYRMEFIVRLPHHAHAAHRLIRPIGVRVAWRMRIARLRSDA